METILPIITIISIGLNFLMLTLIQVRNSKLAVKDLLISDYLNTIESLKKRKQWRNKKRNVEGAAPKPKRESTTKKKNKKEDNNNQ
jgi:hypothetical protein